MKAKAKKPPAKPNSYEKGLLLGTQMAKTGAAPDYTPAGNGSDTKGDGFKELVREVLLKKKEDSFVAIVKSLKNLSEEHWKDFKKLVVSEEWDIRLTKDLRAGFIKGFQEEGFNRIKKATKIKARS